MRRRSAGATAAAASAPALGATFAGLLVRFNMIGESGNLGCGLFGRRRFAWSLDRGAAIAATSVAIAAALAVLTLGPLVLSLFRPGFLALPVPLLAVAVANLARRLVAPG